MYKIIQIPVGNDNYSYIINNGHEAIAIDPFEFSAIDKTLEEYNLDLKAICNTHHHFDHVGGNIPLKEKYSCPVYASIKDEFRIPGFTDGVWEGDTVQVSDISLHVISLLGHTSGHIGFEHKETKSLFVGDTLFSLGCGRLFDGTYDDFYHSLKKIASYPKNTNIYCAHEYTLDNSRFALSVAPKNQDLIKKIKEIKEKRKNQKPTIPTKLEIELLCNPFLSANSVEEFTQLRKLKDNFS